MSKTPRELELGMAARRAPWRDALWPMALLAAVVALAAHGPSHTYRFAQLWQIGAALDLVNEGDWLLPKNQLGQIFRKPQLYAWVEAAILRATGWYNELSYRIPTIVSAAVLVVVTWRLGVRWFGRRAGLAGAVLLVVCAHMGKLVYVALTDMMFAMWIALSLFCADRLLFHPAPRSRRLRWGVGLWSAMILGGLTKGWGLVNFPLVGLTLALAVVLGPGFGALRRVRSDQELGLLARLIGRRLWRAMKATRFGWGMIAYLLVLVPLWLYMLHAGGEEFRSMVGRELGQRITGAGESAPKASSTPALIHLLYWTFPASLLAVGALLLEGPRRWLTRKGAVYLPLCWIAGVVIPFSLAHGFRPDYLLPCYPAVALLGGLAVERILHRGRQRGGLYRAVWEVHYAIPFVAGAALLVLSLSYFFPDLSPEPLAKNLPVPWHVRPETWVMCGALIPLGIALMIGAVVCKLRWKPAAALGLTCAGMLGVVFLETHLSSPHARSSDGVIMRRFGHAVRKAVGDDPLLLFWAEKIGTEAYLRRFGTYIPPWDPTRQETGEQLRQRVLAALNRSEVPWLVTTDRGLAYLGATRPAEVPGPDVYVYKDWELGKRPLRPLPAQLGEVVVASSRAVESQRWGRLYLIRLADDIETTGQPIAPGYVRYRPEEEW
jgi:4-amino-4-deoxy-L-arabinose transferase-like glycosyltransferase